MAVLAVPAGAGRHGPPQGHHDQLARQVHPQRHERPAEEQHALRRHPPRGAQGLPGPPHRPGRLQRLLLRHVHQRGRCAPRPRAAAGPGCSAGGGGRAAQCSGCSLSSCSAAGPGSPRGGPGSPRGGPGSLRIPSWWPGILSWGPRSPLGPLLGALEPLVVILGLLMVAPEPFIMAWWELPAAVGTVVLNHCLLRDRPVHQRAAALSRQTGRL